MAYRLKAGRSIAHEVRRIVRKQLALAIRELRTVGDPQGDAAIHEARRHIKKARAVTRLVRAALSDIYAPVNSTMRLASRLLAPIADGEAVVATLDRLRQKHGRRLPAPTVRAIRTILVERASRIDRRAERDRALLRVVRLLRSERRKVPAWRLNARGFHAVAPGLEKSFRRARKGMVRVESAPTAAGYHSWRQRVKDLWFHVRLLEGRCGNQLQSLERHLETLDGCLGEQHNVVLLERILIDEALLSRRQTARCLRLLRRQQFDLQRQARAAARLFAEPPRRFLRRIKQSWRSAGAPPSAKRTSWPRAA